MKRYTLAFTALGWAVAPFGFAQCPPQELDEFAPPNSEGEERFGTSIAAYDTVALVGSPADDEGGGNAGAAHVFVRAGTTWSEEAKLIADDSNVGEQLGVAVSLWAETALVGAPFDDDNGQFSGSAYVFVRDGTAWIQQAKLLPEHGAGEERYGAALSLCEDTALVGGRLASSVVVFGRTGTTWSEVTQLVGSDTTPDDGFGRAVAMAGDTAVIGATHADGRGTDSGSAYVFTREGTQWSEQAKLTASDGEEFHHFGSSVALSGNTALVSARGHDGSGINSGAVYVFVRRGSEWNEQAILVGHDTGPLDEFGHALAIEGNTVLIGARLEDANGNSSGSAYLFVRARASWSQTYKIVPKDGAAGDEFGASVALDGAFALVGASSDSDQAVDAGSAYAFGLVDEPEVYCTAKTNSLGCVPAIDFSGCPSATASDGYVILARNVRNQQPGGLFYGVDGRDAVPFQGGWLCVATPVSRTAATGSNGNLPPIKNCSGAYRIDMNAFAAGSSGGPPRPELRIPGTLYQAQWWSRDTEDPFGLSFTAALESTVGP